MKLFHIVFTLFWIAVLPPDEFALPFKNNSVFTNAIASISIQLANSVSFITNKTVPQKWLDIVSNLYFPFDNLTQTYLEYESFDLSKKFIE
jgi:trehalose/maltose hydrolase-like predicted phosphorylase